MTELIDLETLLFFLTVTFSDEQRHEKIVSEICEKTGFSREKVKEILELTFQTLTEDLPHH